ncbi:MAG: hypothetical protein HC842_09845, partial [Cytophagales bacterium]|nr:hypothetical protein [Cytophagales bacterium]
MKKIISIWAASSLLSCGPSGPTTPPAREQGLRRFFADDSFWNQPISENPTLAAQNNYWINLLAQDPSCENFGLNTREYTIPIYQVDSTTPTQVVRESFELRVSHKDFEDNAVDTDFAFRQYPSFRGKPIPLPAQLAPSPGSDQHVALVDYERGLAWDMWYVFEDSLGGWRSHTGMHYELFGSGVFDPNDFGMKPGESVHQYGPSRAPGVPAIAGMIMYHEVMAGKIEHRLSCGVRYGAFQQFVYPPAIWTDGNFDGGIPEGSVIQLDPNLDLEQFDLTPEEKVVARALQTYGMVIVDYTKGSTIYAEGLWYDDTRSWEGKLRTWGDEGGIRSIPVKHYRVLDASENLRQGAIAKRRFFHRIISGTPVIRLNFSF